jgi:hypothetical protein
MARKVTLKAASQPKSAPPSQALAFRFARANLKAFHHGRDSAAPEANVRSKECRRSVRIAVYRSDEAPPLTTDVVSGDARELIDKTTEQVLTVLGGEGGSIPDVAVRAVIENLVHADFQGAAVSVLDHGSRLVVADSGSGIDDPVKAMEAGYSTAGPRLRDVIEGVGSGLAVARQAMEADSGSILIGPNLGEGTVVVLTAGRCATQRPSPPEPLRDTAPGPHREPADLSPRRMQVLLFIADGREVGPSEVAEHVGCSLTTAYRDLTKLEQDGLVLYTARGKRVINDQGRALVTEALEPPGSESSHGAT